MVKEKTQTKTEINIQNQNRTEKGRSGFGRFVGSGRFSGGYA